MGILSARSFSGCSPCQRHAVGRPWGRRTMPCRLRVSCADATQRFPEEAMTPARLIATAVVLSVAATALSTIALSTINAAEQTLNPKAIAIKLPDQIPWKGNAAAGNETAVLYGDPDKPGFYVLMSKWMPGHM